MAKITRRRAKRIYPRFNKNYFETQAWAQKGVICGIDEVGRGCLAGPVVTAAVILPPNTVSRLLKDSKEMTPEERLKAFAWIKKHCWYNLGIVHHRLIDERNIWHATLIAMRKALLHLLATAPYRPSAIVIDAMPLKLTHTPYADIPIHHFPFGERKSSSIAAASIVAKVCRDEMMKRLDQIFPGYHLGQHKGYSTPLHKATLKEKEQKLIIHRESFLKHINILGPEDDLFQQSIFDPEDPLSGKLGLLEPNLEKESE